MLNRIIAVVILLPAAILLIALSVANRAPVAFSLDPFSSGAPALSVTLPLFVLIFAAFILGLLIGGVATWLGQRKYRKAARRNEAEAGALKARIEAARAVEPKPVHASGLPALRS
jgi:uncharacterized integral membrane protein